MDEPPVSGWSDEEVPRELVRLARGVGSEDFDRDVAPRLARLTAEQRAAVAGAIDTLLGRHRPPSPGL